MSLDSTYRFNEPGELSQWLCHDDSTINIVVVIIIIITMLEHDLAIGAMSVRLSVTHWY